jgi:hypothetical protein
VTQLSFEQLTAPVTDLSELGVSALEEWRWLVPLTSRPILLTVFGDLFLQAEDGSIEFLDTNAGTLTNAAVSYESWKVELESPDRVRQWFSPGFMAELVTNGVSLKPGEVYSPTIPEVLGGKATAENYTPSHWLAHLHVLGSIHRQVKDLPAGTPITRFQGDQW